MLKGFNKGELVLYISLACYYAFAIPCSYIMCFYLEYKVAGAFGGFFLGLIFMDCCFIKILSQFDFKKEVELLKKKEIPLTD